MVTGGQAPGTFKGFGPGLGVTHAILPNGFCTSTAAPALPEGCNIVDGFFTNGVTLFPLPSATSAKHLYAWTTGISAYSSTISGAVNGPPSAPTGSSSAAAPEILQVCGGTCASRSAAEAAVRPLTSARAS